MKNELSNIRDFIRYLVLKEETTSTDKIVWALLAEDPELYMEALKYVFPYKNDQPGQNAFEKLKDFVKENCQELEMSVCGIRPDEIDYDRLFVSLFL